MEKQVFIPCVSMENVKDEPLLDHDSLYAASGNRANCDGLSNTDQYLATSIEQKVTMKTEDFQSEVDESMRLEVNARTSSCDEYDYQRSRDIRHVRGKYKKRNRSEDDLSSHQCELCQRVFPTRAGMISHKRRVCMATKCHTCRICHKRFKARGNMQQHMTVHSDEKNFFCNMCGKAFKIRKGLMAHIQQTHSTEPHRFRCDLCPYTSKQNCGLKRHMRTHTGEKPFLCDLCGKAVGEKKSLIQHICLHTGKVFKPKMKYTCDMCGKSVSCMTTLRKHVVTVHERREFPCEICNKVLKSIGGFRMHMEGHENETYECSVCHKVFTTKGGLDRHAKQHVLPPEQCHICHKWVAHKIELGRHLRSHASKDSEEYKCPICQYCFGVKNRLERHLNTKHRTFTCFMCFETFNDRDKLAEHKYRKHVSNCIECEFTCNDDQRLEHHVDVHHTWHTCPTCGLDVYGRYMFNTHLYNVHKRRKIRGKFTVRDMA